MRINGSQFIHTIVSFKRIQKIIDSNIYESPSIKHRIRNEWIQSSHMPIVNQSQDDPWTGGEKINSTINI